MFVIVAGVYDITVLESSIFLFKNIKDIHMYSYGKISGF